MRSRTSRSSVARTASLTRSPGVRPTASSSAGSAAIAISSMALMPSPSTASWLTSTRSGAGRATMVPRTSYAAGRRMVPQRPAANAASSAPNRIATRTRRRILLAALAGAEDVVGPPEILGRQDPLAPTPFLRKCHGALVGGAQSDEQQPAADGHAQDARHRLARDEDEIHDGRAQAVPHRRLGGLFENDRLLHGLRLSGGRRRHLHGLRRGWRCGLRGLGGGLRRGWRRRLRGLLGRLRPPIRCGLHGLLGGLRRLLGLGRGLLGGPRRLLVLWRRLLGRRLR